MKKIAIKISSLTKRFGSLTAVDSVSLDINDGEIFGLLGPNGAGKTTLISMLSTILNPTNGTAVVCGSDIIKNKDLVRKSIGIVFQDPSLDDVLTGEENMYFHGKLYGLSDAIIKEKTEFLLKIVELTNKKDVQIKAYSGGMKRRLEIARGLMHSPSVLFLDEPTIGLDPQTRRNLWDYIKKFNKSSKITIIMTTHYMDEADFLCDRIAIIDNGKIIALDSPDKLKDALGGDIIILSCNEAAKLKAIIDEKKLAKKTHILDSALNITVANASKTVAKIIEIASSNNITIDSVLFKRPSLEDVFIHYTGRKIRDESGDEKSSMRLRMRMH
ncbi:MAG: ATP-binding cassette domain-containing protein [archaeon]